MITSYAYPKLTDGERIIASGLFLFDRQSIMGSIIDRYTTKIKEGDLSQRFLFIGAYAGKYSDDADAFTEIGTYERGIDAILALREKCNDKITLYDRYVHSSEDLREIISNVTFNNSILDLKWEFHHGTATMDGEDGFSVWASFERPDTHTGKMGRGTGRKLFIPFGQTDSYVFFTLLIAQDLILRHEHMEGLHYFGHRLLYPHNSVHRLNDLAKDIESQGVRAWIRPGD